jgi:hypothetical protein
MNKRIIAAITGGVWLLAVGSAIAVGFVLDRPLVLRDDSGSWLSRARRINPARQIAVEEEAAESPVLQVPTVLIIGNLRSDGLRAPATGRGVAVMQAPDEVIIGPGVVTHYPEPATKRDAAPSTGRSHPR